MAFSRKSCEAKKIIKVSPRLKISHIYIYLLQPEASPRVTVDKHSKEATQFSLMDKTEAGFALNVVYKG